jgi:hypothetical protein
MGIKLILIVAALVCFILKAFAVPTGRVDCMNLGFAFLTATLLV